MLEQLASLGSGGFEPNRLKKAILELQDRRTSVVAGAAANTAIAVPGITIDDTISSVLMFASGVPSDVTGQASIVDLRATGTVTVATPAAGATVVVGGKTFTATATANDFAGNGAGPYKFLIGATPAATAAALAKAINSAAMSVTASASAAVVTLTAVTPGTAGNAITLVGSAGLTASGATLSGGSATNAIKLTGVSTGNTLVVQWHKKPALTA